MNIKVNSTKTKMILLLILSGLPGCCLIFGSIKLRLSLIFIIGFLILYTFLKYKEFIKEIIESFSNKCGKILFLWLVLCFISGIIACCFRNYNFGEFLYYYIFHAILLVYIPYYLAFNASQRMQLSKIIKYYFIFLITIYILVIIHFIFIHSNIPFLQTIFDYTLTNTRQETIYSEVLRTKSTFVEPSFFARFICLNLLLVYEFSRSKFRLFKNRLLNIFTKKLFPYISWFLLIATKSPIFLIVGIIITLLYFRKILLKRTIIIPVTCLAIILIVIALNSSIISIINASYLRRVINVINSLDSFEAFIGLESSLATRIINLTNQFILFVHNPLFGVGYGNISSLLASQLINSPLALTSEISRAISNDEMAFNSSILFSSLAGTGIITTMVLYSFFIKAFQYVKNDIKFMNLNYTFFMRGLMFYILVFFIISIYTSELSPHKMIIFGLISGIHYKLKVDYGKKQA